MSNRRFELWFAIFCLILCVLGWYFTDRSVRNNLENMLVSEGQNFQEIQFEQLKISMEKELMRRASYYFYMGKVKDFSSSLKDHYQARRANIIFRERNQSLNKFDDYGWDWLDKEGVLTLKGTNCIQDFCLDVEIPWTRTWLTDSSASLVKQLSEMRFLGWSVLLESPELETPKVVKEYFKMADKLEYLKIGNQIFYHMIYQFFS